MYSFDAIKGELNIADAFRNIQYRRDFRKLHPEYFDPDGLVLFCGGQGEGKTLSAVRYIQRLVKIYPQCVVVSNIRLNLRSYDKTDPYVMKEVQQYKSISDVAKMDNGYAGIILFLDEIQVEFNSLESAKIHPSVIQTISQQRKRRLHVVGTTQLFKRLAKPWREQCNAIVDCSSHISGLLQKCSVIDQGTIAEDSNGNLTNYEYSNHFFYFRSKRYFDLYDTSERVNRVGGGM